MKLVLRTRDQSGEPGQKREGDTGEVRNQCLTGGKVQINQKSIWRKRKVHLLLEKSKDHLRTRQKNQWGGQPPAIKKDFAVRVEKSMSRPFQMKHRNLLKGKGLEE